MASIVVFVIGGSCPQTTQSVALGRLKLEVATIPRFITTGGTGSHSPALLNCLTANGNSVGAGDIGERTRVVVGLGQRSVAELEAPHREATAGKVLFAGGADQRPR